jgi:hypothetical protein
MRRHVTSSILTAALALAAATVVYPAVHAARADEAKKNELKRDIERLLSDVAAELRDVPGDSSASDLERTLDYAAQVSSKARELKDHAEGDSDARKMADYYSDYASHYQDAARSLKEMKNGQRRLDDLPRKCEDTAREQAARLRAFTDVHDPRGLDEAPRLARELGKVGKDALEQAERTRYELATWFGRVDDFSDSDGKWNDVRVNLLAAGTAIYDYVVNVQERLKRDDVCGNLAKEERNPVVEQALQKLYEGKKGIELAYESLDRQLGEMSSRLSGLVSDSDESDLQASLRNLDDTEKLLDQLDRAKGNDVEARRRVETWRTIARATRDALAHLLTLKQSQFRVDRAPERCREASDKLREGIRGFAERHDTKGITQIPMQARGLAEPIKDALAKTDTQHPIMERAYSEAYRFDPSEGRWREVRDQLRASATAIFEYWKKARETAHAACDELAKGDQHAEVLRAVADLSRARSDGETELLRLQADHRKWYDGLKELREWYKQDTTNVRQLFCSIPESPGDSAEGDAYAAQLQQIADRMRDRIKPRWRELSDEAGRLIAAADKLLGQQDDDVRTGAARLRAEVVKTMSSIQNLLDNELNGANDPEIRARIELGKNEHRRIQGDSGKCTVSELTIGNRRIDCVRVDGSTCYVVEIKPNNSAAQDRGKEQIRRGVAEIENAARGKRKKAEFTGSLEIFRTCFDEASEALALKEELRVYEYCPPDGELFKDFVVP